MKKIFKIFLVSMVIIICLIFIGREVYLSYVQGQVNIQVNQYLEKVENESHEEILLSDFFYDNFPKNIYINVLNHTHIYPIKYSHNNLEITNERFIELEDLARIDLNTMKFKTLRFEMEIVTPYQKYNKTVSRKNIIQDLETDLHYYDDSELLRINFTNNEELITARNLKFNSKNDKQNKILKIFSLKNYTYFSYNKPVLENIYSKLNNNKMSKYLIEVRSNNKDIIINEKTIFFDLVNFDLKKDFKVKANFDLALYFKIGDFYYTLDLSEKNHIVRGREVSIDPILVDRDIVLNKELDIRLISNDNKLKRMKINNAYINDLKLNSNGVFFRNDMKIINNPFIPMSYEEVNSLIIDEDLIELNSHEEKAVKEAIELIPLEMWRDALIDPEFNIRLWLSEDEITKEHEEYELSRELSYYIDKVLGLSYSFEGNRDSNARLDVILNLHVINGIFREIDYNTQYRETYAHDSSYKKIKIMSYNDAFQHKLVDIKSTLLHEMGHYFDHKKYFKEKSRFYYGLLDKKYNSKYIYSPLLFEDWEKIAIEIYSDDHFYTKEEFFAETFSQYLLHPESLKSRSEKTFNWMNNFVKNYTPLFKEEIDYVLLLNE